MKKNKNKYKNKIYNFKFSGRKRLPQTKKDSEKSNDIQEKINEYREMRIQEMLISEGWRV